MHRADSRVLLVEADGSSEPLLQLRRYQTADRQTILALWGARSVPGTRLQQWSWPTGSLDSGVLLDLLAKLSSALSEVLWTSEGQQQLLLSLGVHDSPRDSAEAVTAPSGPEEGVTVPPE